MNAKKVVLFFCFLFFFQTQTKTMKMEQLNKKGYHVYGVRKLSQIQRRGTAPFDVILQTKDGKFYAGKKVIQKIIDDIKSNYSKKQTS